MVYKKATDWYSVFFILLVPVIITGIIISAMEKNLVSLSGWLISATLLSMYWIEHKQGGVIVELK